MEIIIGVIIGYLFGAIPVGLIVGRIAGLRDVREYGSGATGATNVLRTLGARWAILVFIFDIAKGAFPIFILSQVSDSAVVIALGGTATVIGHVWPVTTGFRGGKGAATAFGIFLALSPVAAGIVLLAGLLILVLTRYVSLMTMVGVLAGCVYIAVMSLTENYTWDPYFKELGTPFWILSLVLFGVIEFKHLPNFRRLLSGNEPKFGKGGKKRSG